MLRGAVPPRAGRERHTALFHRQRHGVTVPTHVESRAGHAHLSVAAQDGKRARRIGADGEQDFSGQQFHLSAVAIQRHPGLRVRIQFQQRPVGQHDAMALALARRQRLGEIRLGRP
ncbi:hypothetical protein G6F22_018535 [Rhizopus arrhizus]|nr:hypothetical protein G6F22_018535 [Rhizopus arrhizus]KAG1247038.1 hypothetical protein G6F65_020373 [Rhizopus arrhizus]